MPGVYRSYSPQFSEKLAQQKKYSAKPKVMQNIVTYPKMGGWSGDKMKAPLQNSKRGWLRVAKAVI
jgi:hypothetical protein